MKGSASAFLIMSSPSSHASGTLPRCRSGTGLRWRMSSVVYRTELLGPAGQNDLVHYETRLKDGLDDPGYSIAMQILAEASTQQVFAPAARRRLERLYSSVVDDVPGRIADVLDVLIHDGYVEAGDDGYCFPSRLLKDWWAARVRDHHIPLGSRRSDDK